MDKPGDIRVHCPLSRRLLFVYNPRQRRVVIAARGIESEVDLSALDADPNSPTAVVSRPAQRPPGGKP